MKRSPAKKCPVVINHDEGEVLVFGEPVHFAPSQYKLLLALVSANGKIVSRESLLKILYPEDPKGYEHDLRVVDQGVHKSRELLGKAAKYMVTVTTRGYKWDTKVK